MTGSGKRIDVLLVNPGSRAAVYQELGDQYSAIEPPSLAGLSATYVRKRGLSVDRGRARLAEQAAEIRESEIVNRGRGAALDPA